MEPSCEVMDFQLNCERRALTAAEFWGKRNLDEGMLSTEGIIPTGAGLHEPVLICLPLVIGKLGTVRQKLMKLFVEVREGTCRSAGTSCPSLLKPGAMAAGSRAKNMSKLKSYCQSRRTHSKMFGDHHRHC
jgi:hypothetical protein